jgi:hypothetical protein
VFQLLLVRSFVGTAFGGPEKFKGLGVFFDTYSNGHHDVSC